MRDEGRLNSNECGGAIACIVTRSTSGWQTHPSSINVSMIIIIYACMLIAGIGLILPTPICETTGDHPNAYLLYQTEHRQAT